MKSRSISLLLLLLVSFSAQSGETPIAGYSTERLRAPLFGEAQIAVEATAINNWLNANLQKLTYDQMKGPREHLYYLIDSRVKQHYATEKNLSSRLIVDAPTKFHKEFTSWSDSTGSTEPVGL